MNDVDGAGIPSSTSCATGGGSGMAAAGFFLGLGAAFLAGPCPGTFRRLLAGAGASDAAGAGATLEAAGAGAAAEEAGGAREACGGMTCRRRLAPTWVAATTDATCALLAATEEASRATGGAAEEAGGAREDAGGAAGASVARAAAGDCGRGGGGRSGWDEISLPRVEEENTGSAGLTVSNPHF